MNNTFTTAKKYLLTSESVTEGHPDKVCDQISDAILDAILAQDPAARVACDCVVTTGLLLVTGEITTSAYVEIAEIARQTILDIGYDRAKYGFDGETCGVIVSIKEQSSDIAMGVDEALECKIGEEEDCNDGRSLGAGDQGMMIGFACDETPEYMPLPIALAHRICKRLAQVRKDGTIDYLRPDGKSQVTVEYSYGKPVRVDSVVVSTQHHPDVTRSQIVEDVIEHVIQPVVPAELLDEHTRYLVNPTGRFVTGGPKGDAGLTGRKLIVDTYGGAARHGGGAFSGKDPTKVDRSATYMTRYIAKNLVAAGKIPDEEIVELIKRNFDLRPGAIIADLDLRRPIYRATAAYGHFGRDDIDAPWERLDRVETLKQQAALAQTDHTI
jgi:S-adenosylmethionine synthetase